MNNFNKNKKIIIVFGLIILAILIIWYAYFYSPDYNFITEEELFYNKNDKEEIDISQNNIYKEDKPENEAEIEKIYEENLIKVHIARRSKRRRGY